MIVYEIDISLNMYTLKLRDQDWFQ